MKDSSLQIQAQDLACHHSILRRIEDDETHKFRFHISKVAFIGGSRRLSGSCEGCGNRSRLGLKTKAGFSFTRVGSFREHRIKSERLFTNDPR